MAVGIAERLTRPVSGNLSEWSRPTLALLRTGVPQELADGVIFTGGIRKLSDFNTVILNNTKVYLI